MAVNWPNISNCGDFNEIAALFDWVPATWNKGREMGAGCSVNWEFIKGKYLKIRLDHLIQIKKDWKP